MDNTQTKYFIMVDNVKTAYPIETTNDLAYALRRCRECNFETGQYEARNVCRFYVVRNTDGQTWECVDGKIYRIIHYPMQGEVCYEGVAI